MTKIWTYLIVIAAVALVLKLIKPDIFTGITSQRGIFGTGTGLYNGGNET